MYIHIYISQIRMTAFVVDPRAAGATGAPEAQHGGGQSSKRGCLVGGSKMRHGAFSPI